MDHFWTLRLLYRFSKTFRFYCALFSLSTDICLMRLRKCRRFIGVRNFWLGTLVRLTWTNNSKYSPLIYKNPSCFLILREILVLMFSSCMQGIFTWIITSEGNYSVLSTPHRAKSRGHIRYLVTTHLTALLQEQFTSSSHSGRTIPDVRHSELGANVCVRLRQIQRGNGEWGKPIL